jgi:phosphatidylglycerol:prolipoprotein diacylglycerol transferase
MMGLSGVSTFLLLFFRKKKYGISWFNLVVILVAVGAVGYYGAAGATYLADGVWPGIRFYGTVLFVTISLWIFSKILKLKWPQLMDYYAPVDIFALVIMKFNCLRFGCCAGIEVSLPTGSCFCFPSQIVELLVALFIFALLMALEFMDKCNGYRYSLYLICYGLTRFILDAWREDRGRLFNFEDLRVSVAQLFCIVLVCLGILSICFVKRQKSNNNT